jgi:hypothetical protein
MSGSDFPVENLPFYLKDIACRTVNHHYDKHPQDFYSYDDILGQSHKVHVLPDYVKNYTHVKVVLHKILSADVVRGNLEKGFYVRVHTEIAVTSGNQDRVFESNEIEPLDIVVYIKRSEDDENMLQAAVVG